MQKFGKIPNTKKPSRKLKMVLGQTATIEERHGTAGKTFKSRINSEPLAIHAVCSSDLYFVR